MFQKISEYLDSCIDRKKRSKLSGISGKVSNYREYIHSRISNICDVLPTKHQKKKYQISIWILDND